MSVAKDITPRLYEKLAQKNDQLFGAVSRWL